MHHCCMFAIATIGFLPTVISLCVSTPSNIGFMFGNLCVIDAGMAPQTCQNHLCSRRQLGFASATAKYAESINKRAFTQWVHVLPRVFGNARSVLRLSGGSKNEEKIESKSPSTVVFASNSSLSQQKALKNSLVPVWLRIVSGLLAFGTLTAMFNVIKNASAGKMYASGFSAGLASSSCCLFQLFLNGLSALGLLNVGCAGFNKTLGPWRTFFRSITAGWLMILWFMGLRNEWPKQQLIVTSFIAIGLSFLPEILTALGKRSSAQPLQGREVVMKIEGMGCEACQAHVQATIEAAPGVAAAQVAFATGAATVRIADGSAFDARKLLAHLEEKGYRTSIVD
jgi:copper chaperone CopZ